MEKQEKTSNHLAIEAVCLEQAQRLIRTAQRPVLVCHVSPDGDGMGSLVGLGRGLRQLGLRPTLVSPDPLPAKLAFIPDSNLIQSQAPASFDLVIALDCSDLRRLGSLTQAPAFGQVPLLNIDHHLTNEAFGDVNLVSSAASSTAEVVLHLLRAMDVPIDDQMATALLVGIVTDTRGFRTDNVTPHVVAAALRLMEAGASLPEVTRKTLDTRPLAAIRLWGAALANLQVEAGVVWAAIPLDMRRSVDFEGNGDAGLASFLISAQEAQAAVVFVEQEDGGVEVGLRATPGFDVAQVALQFGGGGHALAAGCPLPGPLSEAQDRFLRALKASLDAQRAARAG